MPRLSSRFIVCAAFSAVLIFAVTAAAQRRFFPPGGGRSPRINNIAYDGKFTFVRVRYNPAPGGNWAGGRAAWTHGFPLAERNLMRIMKDLSFLDMHEDRVNVLSLDDPKLFQYPIAYIIEVGWWTMNEKELQALRNYLLKGGFLIVDDFKPAGWRGLPGGGWEPFRENVERLFPGAILYDMNARHQIFHSFFDINKLDEFPQAYNFGKPVFRGLYEDNDPSKRLLMIVNYNTDISQYWEWSGRGIRPFDDTNEAYKLGVNYLIYGMTH